MEFLKNIKTYKTYESNAEKITEQKYLDYIKDFAIEVFQEKEKIDFGRTADVFFDPLNQSCYKVITRPEVFGLIAEQEAEILMNLKNSENNSKVKTPKPIFSIEARFFNDKSMKTINKGILAMERINGISLRDAILGKEEFPKNFNFEEFFIELEKFIKIMHEEGIYHRDFHDGNIMIDSETGNPWLIDFGRSKKRVLTDENPYETDFGITLPDDLQQLSLVKKSTKESLELDMQYKGRRPEEFNPEEFYFDKPKTLGYKEVEQFSLNIKQSLLEMKENNLTEIEIKDGLGFYLVKDKTEAFEKRKNSKLILYPKTFQGDIYFVCRN